MKRIAAIIIVMTIAGCANVQAGSGNLRPFLPQVLTDHGATLPPVSAVPNIQAEWEYRPDENGFVLDVAGGSFAKIDHLFRSYFGAPQIWTVTRTECSVRNRLADLRFNTFELTAEYK